MSKNNYVFLAFEFSSLKLAPFTGSRQPILGCLRKGRVDASCCVDSMYNKACEFQENVITGVVCCRNDLDLAGNGALSTASSNAFGRCLRFAMCSISHPEPHRVMCRSSSRTNLIPLFVALLDSIHIHLLLVFLSN
ncbi:unnamed protein product [Soboliphyme baturini]|uniref:Uncharacterized protein n=1 Tax=Soboliphyme baturini TaxID=241478 RepID=A0A183IK98_9BILA|nr:unnamed protein product [Soboliphyme baturini]